MKITENRENDLNRRFMNPESIEKAPEGFTGNIMSAVRVEPQVSVRKRDVGIKVPLAVLAFMLALAIISVFAGSDNSVPGGEISKLLQSISFVKIKAISLPGLNLPGLAVYIILGIFVLLIFDLFLGRIFYRRHL